MKDKGCSRTSSCIPTVTYCHVAVRMGGNEHDGGSFMAWRLATSANLVGAQKNRRIKYVLAVRTHYVANRQLKIIEAKHKGAHCPLVLMLT